MDDRKQRSSRAPIPAAALALFAVIGLARPDAALANHPVLVEGNNCANGGPGVTTVPPGTCGDFDGDGLIGTAEDADNATDRIFGTITAALAMANGGANQNGRVTIVTSGRFAEIVTITGAAGNVTLEAAPGVEANIDAVLAGDAGNNTRQASPGIIVDAPNTRIITLRNLVSRNWTEGIQVRGASRVVIDGCRLENNKDYGIHVVGTARATITHALVTATGFRAGTAADNNPNPGAGIEFEDGASGVVGFTTIAGSAAAGLSNGTSDRDNVTYFHVIVSDNNPNFDGRFGR